MWNSTFFISPSSPKQNLNPPLFIWHLLLFSEPFPPNFWSLAIISIFSLGDPNCQQTTLNQTPDKENQRQICLRKELKITKKPNCWSEITTKEVSYDDTTKEVSYDDTSSLIVESEEKHCWVLVVMCDRERKWGERRQF